MQKLESELSGLCKANTVLMSLTGLVAHVQEEFDDSCARDEHDLSELQTEDNADWNMLYSAVRHHTCVQLLPDGDGQKFQCVERVIKNLQKRASHHSSLVGSGRASFTSDRRHLYEVCLIMLCLEFTRPIRECTAV